MRDFISAIPLVQRVSALALLLTLISFCTWFVRYQNPPNLFWDENFHIASAQKYLNRVFFMEPHPPLGKLLIALGEGILDRNSNDTDFIAVDYAKDLPKGFSFEGYRFFPVLLGWLTVPLFFFLLLALSRNAGGSFLIALLYAFDNALIVHMRGAMLEGIQMFFVISALLTLALVHGRRPYRGVEFAGIALASVLFSAAVATKVTALVIGFAFIPIFVPLLSQPRQLWRALGVALFAFFAVQYLVWQTHFSLGQRVVRSGKLDNQGVYRASETYQKILVEGTQLNPLNFPIMVRDSAAFFQRYEKGVPLLNLCKPGEAGSPPYLWPIGARSISYRWDSSNGTTSHIHLQVNPVVWFVALGGLFLAGVYVLNLLVFDPVSKTALAADLKLQWILTYAGMWAVYMAIMLSVDRVMYLYHYFIPLVFTLSLFLLVIPRIVLPQRVTGLAWLKPLLALLLTIGTLSSFYFFAPLTYAWPITDEQMTARALLDSWDLHCPNCSLTNRVARPWVDPKDKPIPVVRIGTLVSRDGMQEWGEPVQDKTVERSDLTVDGVTYRSGLGVHAHSEIRFTLGRRYFSLGGIAALPDYLKTRTGQPASVTFEILLDGIKVWTSRRITPQDAQQSFNVPVVQAETLELRVIDGGDGNENDHALWLDLTLK